MDVRGHEYEAEDVIQRMRAPIEGFIVAQGYRMMLNMIRNYINNKID
jgi:hypothetical protein